MDSATIRERFKLLLSECAAADVPLSEVRRAVLAAYVLTVLRQERGNQSKAARRLGLHRNTCRATLPNWDCARMWSESRNRTAGGGVDSGRRFHFEYEPGFNPLPCVDWERGRFLLIPFVRVRIACDWCVCWTWLGLSVYVYKRYPEVDAEEAIVHGV